MRICMDIALPCLGSRFSVFGVWGVGVKAKPDLGVKFLHLD